VRAPQYRRQASNVVIRPPSVRQSDANFVQAGNNSAICRRARHGGVSMSRCLTASERG
jgi:hypothetical protein